MAVDIVGGWLKIALVCTHTEQSAINSVVERLWFAVVFPLDEVAALVMIANTDRRWLRYAVVFPLNKYEDSVVGEWPEDWNGT